MRMQFAAFKLKFQEAIVYRGNLITNFLFGLIPLLVNILLWKAIYGSNKNQIGNYTYSQMIMYFVLAFFCSNITSSRDVAVKLAEMIQDGSLHNFLLKPTNYLLLNFRLFLAEKVIYLMNIFIPFAIFIILINQYIYVNISNLRFFLISLILAFIMNYLIYCMLGMITTWVEEISALLDLWRNITTFFSGGLFPLDLLPANLFVFVSFLPFKYTLYIPIDIYMGHLNKKEIFMNLRVQIGWCFLLLVLLIFIWKKATKKYSGYGS